MLGKLKGGGGIRFPISNSLLTGIDRVVKLSERQLALPSPQLCLLKGMLMEE